MVLRSRLAPLLRHPGRHVLWRRDRKGSSWGLDPLVDRMCLVRYRPLWVLRQLTPDAQRSGHSL